jgi:hypothetical protein
VASLLDGGSRLRIKLIAWLVDIPCALILGPEAKARVVISITIQASNLNNGIDAIPDVFRYLCSDAPPILLTYWLQTCPWGRKERETADLADIFPG